MRRTAMAVMAGALVLGVSAAAGCGPEAAGPDERAGATPQEAAASGTAGMKTVEYGGYVLDVPAAWPVYRLSDQPTRCVRYDRHAVYLGNPGPDQRCPAHLVGRTEAVLIDGAAAGAVIHQRGAVPGEMNGAATQRPAIRRDAPDRELVMTIHRPGLAITATYANDPAVVERIISSVRDALPAPPVTAAPITAQPVTAQAGPAQAGPAPSGPAPSGPAPSGPAPSGPAPSGPAPSGPAPSGPAPSGPAPTAPPSWSRDVRQVLAVAGRAAMDAAVAPSRGGSAAARTATAGRVRSHKPLAGFDTCTAPSTAAMRAWRPYYAAVAVYLGGVNRACDEGNLSARWVRRVKAMGWSLIPAYVGLQPPCDHFSGKIRPKRAAREGAAAARDAVRLARGLRLRGHAPIYFDMEGYDSARRRCRSAVLTFLDAWTRHLRHRGYVPGVYSSASSGAEDLGGARTIGGHRLARPESIWFALWDGHVNLRGEPYLLASWWPRDRRIKQFRGSRWQKHGRFRLDIDRDEVFGAAY